MSRLLWPRLLSLLILTARCCPLRKPPSRSKFIIPVWASWLGTHELGVKSTSAVHLHWSCAIHNTMGPNCPSAVSDVIVVCWIFCYCLTNVAHQFFWVLFTNMVQKYRRLWLCTVCYWYSVKEFDNLEADAWDGEHLTKNWCLKGKLYWNYEF